MVWRRVAGDARRDMQCKPAEVVPTPLAFACMQPSARDKAEARYLLRDCLCALNGSRRAGERQNETVPRGIDFLASKVLHFAPYDGIMVMQPILPPEVAHSRNFFC